jgi:tripartite-type tricarboxylate transporter receptor subunit TctC
MIRTTRRAFLAGAAGSGTALLLARSAWADEFPSKALEIIVGQPPGGGTDTYARAIAAALPPFLNDQAAVVVNRPGGNGVLAMEQVMASAADGYTLSLTSAGTAVIKRVWDGNGPDLAVDMKPVATIGRYASCIVVNKDAPYANMEEWMAAVKSSSKPVLWSHTGRGSIHHIAGQALLTNYELPTKDVPFQGAPDARNALMNGEVEFSVFGTQNLTGFEEQVRSLGVISDGRDPFLSDVPTMAEQGLETPLLFTPIMLHVPKDTDPGIVAQIEAAVRQACETDVYKQATQVAGLPVWFQSSAETQAWTEKANKDWAPVIEEIKARST